MLSLKVKRRKHFMGFEFYKYQGTGNDFVMIDGRDKSFDFAANEVADICDRRFGIGADGLIILKNHPECDFEMDYYNADGSKSFCGNGSRCAQAFAEKLGIIDNTSQFLAIDGMHVGKKIGDHYATKMGDVNHVEELGKDLVINTGSPHYIQYVQNLNEIDVEELGSSIRYSPAYKRDGINVNFVEEKDGKLYVRTYERGVEAETYSCGTGVTAVAIAHLYRNHGLQKKVELTTKGGSLMILLDKRESSIFENIWLVGPATEVFLGNFSN